MTAQVPGNTVLPRTARRSVSWFVPWLTIALLCLPFAGSAEQPADREFATLLARFQAAADAERDRYGLPGITAAFVLPDGRMGKVASGFADVESRMAMTPDTRMLSGSVGKTMTAAMALKLAEQGVWSLDDELSQYLGQHAWFDRLPNAPLLTVRLLLQHRGGLENYYDNPRFFDLLREETARDPAYFPEFETLIEFVSDREPLFAPGAGFRYTDVGYLLVGLAIEQATGRRYYELVREYFLDPLGLLLTSPSDSRRLPGLAQGYANGRNPLLQGPRMLGDDGRLTYDPAIEFTAGGLVTNAGDLARWARALYAGPSLEPASIAALLERPAGIAPGDAAEAYYGLGVRVDPPVGRGLPSYGHDGYIPGYRTSMRYYPQSGIAVAIQINTEDGIWEEMTGGRDALDGHVDLRCIRERLNAVVVPGAEPSGACANDGGDRP